MRDQLTFSAQRRGHEIAALCQGQDRAGTEVDFDLDDTTLRRNSHLQYEWAGRVGSARYVYRALIHQGMDADAAWMIAEPLLPAPLTITTGWLRSPQTVNDAVANDGDELGERGDDVLGESLDG